MKRFSFLAWLLMAFFAFTPAVVRAQGPETQPAGDDMAVMDQKLNAIDMSNADQLFTVAEWAVKSKNDKVRERGRKLLKEVLELDSSNEGAHKLLNHVKVGDTWYDDKTKAAAAQKAEKIKEMKEKGLVEWKGGWIKETDKTKFNDKTWKRDDNGVWMSEADIHTAKGEVNYKGTWLRMSPDDAKRMEAHKKKTGEDIIIVTTQHFRLHLPVQPKSMERYAKQAEALYDWFMKEFEVPEEQQNSLWPHQDHIWAFWSLQQYHDWITSYQEEYKLSEDLKKMLRDHPSGWGLDGILLSLIVNGSKKDDDLENQFIHRIAHTLAEWYTRMQINEWEVEAFANLLEEKFSAEKYGHVSCSTISRYGGGGDVAKKEFNTKDAKSTIKGLARLKYPDEPSLEDMTKADLNSLNGEMLSKGYSIFEWLYNKQHDKFVRFIQAMGAHPVRQAGPDAKVQALREVIADVFPGQDLTAFENAWREYVLKNYTK